MEDFVTFEQARKLKEKGFRERCLTYYDVEDNVGLLYNTQYSDDILPCQYTDLLASHNAKEVSQPDDSKNCVDAPTISQVLKWLREEKGLSVEPYSCACGWRVTICLTGNVLEGYVSGGSCVKDEVKGPNDGGAYDWFEQAALAGIEYVLDNLI